MTNEKYTPKGIVQIIDAETGEMVYETHNMIVESGRSLILNAIFNGEDITVANFKKYYETGVTKLTEPSMTFANISSNVATYDGVTGHYHLFDIDTTTSSSLTLGGDMTVSYPSNASLGISSSYNDGSKQTNVSFLDRLDVSNIKMNLHFIINSSIATKPITAVGLLYEDNSEYILFSRAPIDPVYIRQGRTYIVHYSLYF